MIGGVEKIWEKIDVGGCQNFLYPAPHTMLNETALNNKRMANVLVLIASSWMVGWTVGCPINWRRELKNALNIVP